MVTVGVWGLMYVISFIPFIGTEPFITSYIEALMFWAGIIFGIITLFAIADFTGKEVIIQDKKEDPNSEGSESP